MANEDWEEAVQRIHNAQQIEATNLDLTNLRIDALPEQIADLKDLRHLSAYYTQISDLSPISGLTQLQHLDLDTAPIVDLSEIAGLVNLTRLNLDNTGVSDLAPIAGLTALEELRLESTAVTNLAGVVGLTRLNNVVVGNTSINDISSFINHTRLRSLSLSRTPVADLRPLLKVAFQPLEFGVTFEGTPACQDPFIAAAAEIKDNEERLQALLTHLRTLPPWPEPLPDFGASEPKVATPPKYLPFKKLTLSAARTLLEQDHPLIQARCQAVIAQLDDGLAYHRMRIPNDGDALDAHRQVEQSLTYAKAMIASVHAAVPPGFTDAPLGDAEVDRFRVALNAAIEKLTDAARYIDRPDHTPTYAGLLKVGCAAAVGSVFALLPGVGIAYAVPAVFSALYGKDAVMGVLTSGKGSG